MCWCFKMPTPGAVKQLSIHVTGAAVLDGVYIKVINGNTKEYLIKQTSSDGNVTFPLMELSDDGTPTGTKTGITVGDRIFYQLIGDAFGGGSYTVDSRGGRKITITAVDRTTSNTVAVSI